MTSAATDRIAIPTGVESAPAKLIYMYLRTCGSATVEDISEDLQMPVLTLCRILPTLAEKGLVSRDDEVNTWHPC